MKLYTAIGAAAAIAATMAPVAQAQTYVDSLNVPERPVSGLEAQLEASKSYTVVAIPDSGINPYHARFQRRAAIPQSILNHIGVTRTCNLSQTGTWEERVAADQDSCWSQIQTGDVVYFAGTSVVGAMPEGVNSILDAGGHGTNCAGSVLNGNNEAILLTVASTGRAAMNYLASQPAVDAITTSFGLPGSPPEFGLLGISPQTREAVQNGKMHFGACDNSPATCLQDSTGGPPWSIGIAGSADTTKEITSGTSPDFIADFTQRLPVHTSVDEYETTSGTSFATPLSAGTTSAAIQLLRDEAGTKLTGAIDRFLVTDADGNGVYHYGQFREALERAALPVFLLDTYASGFGLVEPSIAPSVIEHIAGREELPAPSADVQLVQDTVLQAREVYWLGAVADPGTEATDGTFKDPATFNTVTAESEQSSASTVAAGLVATVAASIAAVATLL